MFRHILLPTDGSPLSTRAAKLAVELAKSSGARLTALHVIPPFAPTTYMEGMGVYPELFSPVQYKRATEARAKRMLGKVATLAKAAGVPCETKAANGRAPWEAIIKTAKSKRCDAIVMASHGRRGLESLLLGSETTKVLTHTKTPVLVCH
jgi:nucleotide-binding universal stress UspA family protein